MAQGITITSSNPYLRADMEEFKITCDWTGTQDMAVSQAIAANYALARATALLSAPYPERIRGKIAKVETIPGASGDKATYVPAGVYTLTLLDPYGLDLLDGAGASRSVSAAETIVFSEPVPVDDDLTLTIATVSTTDLLGGSGAFTGAATGWTLGVGWAYGTNNVAKTAGAGTATADAATFTPVATVTYELIFTISGWSAAANRTLTPSIGGTAGTAISADGTYTQQITATNATVLTFTPTGTDAANVACTLDSVTVKKYTPQGRVIIYII